MPKSKSTALTGLLISSVVALIGFGSSDVTAQAWRSDVGDGTYRNPILNADYPDPDLIRVGDEFYLTSTTFVNAPGITLLHSRDLVNWDIAGHVVDRLDGNPKYDMVGGTEYRHGLFATSLRHHDGIFWLAVTPVGQNTRIYYSKDIKGPWSFHQLDRAAFDPGLFFDSDGHAYIFTSVGSDGTVRLLGLSADLSAVTDDKKIYYYKGAEGSKVIRRGDWYYLFNAIPSRLGLVVSRAKSLGGPWETRDQIDDKSGGHQGALVDLPNGDWMGFVMVDAGAIGRTTNLSPVYWVDDWPVWGSPERPAQVPQTAPMPIKSAGFREPPTSDTFSTSKLGVQWQWNHNPDNAKWSLTERPGFLRLKATQAADFWTARNTLVQKSQGPVSYGIVKLDLRGLREGDQCGFGTFGKFNGQIVATVVRGGHYRLMMQVAESTTDGLKVEQRATGITISKADIFLRTRMDFPAEKAWVDYSTDGKTWTNLGGDFPMAYDWRTSTFQGQQYSLFCFNPKPSQGHLDVDSFSFAGGE